jgi:hypothetical protein
MKISLLPEGFFSKKIRFAILDCTALFQDGSTCLMLAKEGNHHQVVEFLETNYNFDALSRPSQDSMSIA